jgi:hypothetical protein
MIRVVDQGLSGKADRKEADVKYLAVSRFDEAVSSVIASLSLRPSVRRNVLLIGKW